MPPRLPGARSFALHGEDLLLLPQRALWWPRRQTVVVADIHLGKSEAYRALGIPIPAGIGEEALGRLEAVCAACAATRLVVLGDLVHSEAALSAAVRASVAQVRGRLPRELLLVRGNHDHKVERLPTEWEVTEVEAPVDDAPFAFLHQPAAVRGRYALAGHLHPTCTVGSGLAAIRLPCFHFGPRIAVLPAFSAFTRGVPMRAEPGDSLFVVAEGEVLAVQGDDAGAGAGSEAPTEEAR